MYDQVTKENNDTKKAKESKDLLEINGKLLYAKMDFDDVNVEDMYKDNYVPGEYAGDC